ncbi:ROK family protein, partial [Staphylococcus pseudintermedius]
GVGGGALQEGRFIEGFNQPEMGHMLGVPHPKDDYAGSGPFHGNCLEGMAAGPAIKKRLGKKGQEAAEDDPYWEIEASYIDQCAHNTTVKYSPAAVPCTYL